MTGPLDRFYRPSPELTPARALVRTLAQMLIFWTTFLWIGPALLVRLESSLGEPLGRLPEWVAAGWSLFAAASALGVWSAVSMSVMGLGTPLPTSCAPHLVVCGPYALVRNPMAVAGIAQGLAVGLVRASPFVLVYAFAGAVLWHVTVRPSEERDLERRFGADYRTYRAATPLWRPGLRPNAPRP